MNGGAGTTDTFAAEFVLGTLDADERRAANQLLASDEGFADRVRLWERRLGELHLMVEPVEPASDIWQRIKARMPEVQQFAEMIESEPEPEPAEPQPEPKPEAQSEAHAEIHSEWQTETALEPERVLPLDDERFALATAADGMAARQAEVLEDLLTDLFPSSGCRERAAVL